MPSKFCKALFVFGILLFPIAAPLLQAQVTPALATPAPTGPTVETLVCIRHGEKPGGEVGQLNITGLNRSLALPRVLTSKFGKPNFIFAPDPGKMLIKEHIQVCYLRPLATIEPTAILLDLPVNTLFGYSEIGALQKELDKPDYANSMVFIAWEHKMLEKFVRQEVVAHGGEGTLVPFWNGDDFDAIYLLKLTRQIDGTTTVSFSLDHEGLDHLSNDFPAPAPTTGTSQSAVKAGQ